MGLPQLTVPTFTTVIPSTKKKIKYRPFLSKEEKILMMVKQSDDEDSVLKAMKDIIDVCTFEKLNVSKLAIFDIEYLFLRLRAKSVGEIIEIDMKCNNMIDVLIPPVDDELIKNYEQKACGGLIPFAINIDDIKVNTPKEHTNVIKLQKDIGITLRYPSIDDLKMIEDNKDNDVEIITNLIENIFDKDNVYDAESTSREEIDAFMENVSTKQIETIRKKFFYTLPTLEYHTEFTCTKCGNKGEYTFKGVNDFF